MYESVKTTFVLEKVFLLVVLSGRTKPCWKSLFVIYISYSIAGKIELFQRHLHILYLEIKTLRVDIRLRTFENE